MCYKEKREGKPQVLSLSDTFIGESYIFAFLESRFVFIGDLYDINNNITAGICSVGC